MSLSGLNKKCLIFIQFDMLTPKSHIAAANYRLTLTNTGYSLLHNRMKDSPKIAHSLGESGPHPIHMVPNWAHPSQHPNGISIHSSVSARLTRSHSAHVPYIVAYNGPRGCPKLPLPRPFP